MGENKGEDTTKICLLINWFQWDEMPSASKTSKQRNKQQNKYTHRKEKNQTLTNLLKRKSDFIPESVCSQEVWNQKVSERVSRGLLLKYEQVHKDKTNKRLR